MHLPLGACLSNSCPDARIFVTESLWGEYEAFRKRDLFGSDVALPVLRCRVWSLKTHKPNERRDSLRLGHIHWWPASFTSPWARQ